MSEREKTGSDNRRDLVYIALRLKKSPTLDETDRSRYFKRGGRR